MTKKVAIMKGDGIGPEIVDAMTGILKECNLQSEMIFCDAGSEQWEKNGSKDPSYIPESTMKTLEEVDEAISNKVDIIMLDNMSIDMMNKAIKNIDGKAKTEVSGGVTFEKLSEISKSGADFVSIGALTHSPAAVDISMNITTK